MKLLYIAYSCSPVRGSEDRIGWMLPLTMAQHHEVSVLTREERRREIEAYCHDHPVPVRFFYVDTPAASKELFRGSAYSLRLNLWHRRALPVAKELCSREGIDLIHQITPVEFRSIGDYGCVETAKFVCGPVGGGEYIPKKLWHYAAGSLPEELARFVLNLAARCRLKRRGILRRCDGLLFANRETAQWLRPVLPEGISMGIYPEVGIGTVQICPETADRNGDCVILAASRLIRRKGHALLLDALAELKRDCSWKLLIAGEGPMEKSLRRRCAALGLSDRVTFLGRVPFEKMEQLYSAAHLLVMPSLRETTGSIVPEAMARGIPVVTMSRFGAGALLRDDAGWGYDGGKEELGAALQEAMTHPEEIIRRGSNAAAAMNHHTWANKAAHYEKLYKTILSREE